MVFVTIYGFDAVSEFSGICAPWLFVMFTSGALVLLPALSLSVLGKPLPAGWDDLIALGNQSIWTGVDSNGEPGIGLIEVIGFAWAANSITHFGLINMALLRFAKKKIYGLATSTGMMFGHYVAWIAAGIMGAGAAVILGKSIVELDPGDVAYYALGWSGFVIVIVAGWTTAIANLYRAGLAAQAIFSNHSKKENNPNGRVGHHRGRLFPFVFSQILPLLTYIRTVSSGWGDCVCRTSDFSPHRLYPVLVIVSSVDREHPRHRLLGPGTRVRIWVELAERNALFLPVSSHLGVFRSWCIRYWRVATGLNKRIRRLRNRKKSATKTLRRTNDNRPKGNRPP